MTPKEKQQLDSIIDRLHKAVILELSTIPPYLTALYSIMPGTNIEATKIIKSVALEEMLHMVLAANTLSALGGRLEINKKNVPQYPLNMLMKPIGKTARKIEINLRAFSDEALDTFLNIELPEDFLQQGIAFRDTTIPEITVGAFYKQIIDDLTELHGSVGDEIFCGDPNYQITEKYYWGAGGKAITITDISSAQKAIETIMEQGEGMTYEHTHEDMFKQAETVPHYFRFNELKEQRRYAPGSSRRLDPGGEPLRVNFDHVYPLRINAEHKRYISEGARPDVLYLSSRFNNKYTQMLLQLQEGFNGNPEVFHAAIVDCMREMATIARQLVQISLNEHEHAAPTFEWSADFD